MATAEELRAQISATKQAIQDVKQQFAQASRERDEAIERQQLRRDLEGLQEEKQSEEWMLNYRRTQRMKIDQDLQGPHMPATDETILRNLTRHPMSREVHEGNDEDNIFQEETKRSSVVARAEYVWKIGEMSWLVEALEHEMEDSIMSDTLKVGGSCFYFKYTPAGGDEGTLSIWHDSSPKGVTFRYKILIRRKGGEFVQWGPTGNICKPHDNADELAFGPDVPEDGNTRPQGIFGCSHKELVKSDWVEDDALTVRFELEVRLSMSFAAIANMTEEPIEVPGMTIVSDFAALLENGKSSDVTIRVEGETLNAHALILSARSQVFDKLLNGSMRESVSKVIEIEDCSARAFKTLLRFLYTDDLSCVGEALEEARIEDARMRDQSCSSSICSKQGSLDRVAWLQSLLAVSHKYAVARLQAWCEKQLCECITMSGVCSILCQANLYEAKQLVNACLKFIKDHYSSLIVTEEFGILAKEWPDVLLKVDLCAHGVSESCAKPAIEASQRKRKREE
mmetsp:Transcript_7209/g.11587  ORF Transcript_7209/g.11587 Transcript_7209/m.11587 type:complete len:510 (-) Transcript_7209:103-1632(-)